MSSDCHSCKEVDLASPFQSYNSVTTQLKLCMSHQEEKGSRFAPVTEYENSEGNHLILGEKKEFPV